MSRSLSGRSTISSVSRELPPYTLVNPSGTLVNTEADDRFDETVLSEATPAPSYRSEISRSTTMRTVSSFEPSLAVESLDTRTILSDWRRAHENGSALLVSESGSQGLESSASVGTVQSARTFLYYQVYANDSLIPVKTPYNPEDDTLGRIPARRIAPPRTIRNIKNCIAQIEGFTFEVIEEVYLDSDSEFQSLDDQARVSFTEDIDALLCVVLRQPVSLTSLTGFIPSSSITRMSAPTSGATAADDTGRFLRGPRSELFEVIAWPGNHFSIPEEEWRSSMIATLKRVSPDDKTAHIIFSVLQYLKGGLLYARNAYQEVWRLEEQELHENAPAPMDAAVASKDSQLRFAKFYQAQGVNHLFREVIPREGQGKRPPEAARSGASYSQAIDSLDKALGLDPRGCHCSNLYKALASFGVSITPIEPTLAHLRSFTRDEADARVLLSFMYLRRGHYKLAWAEFQEVVKLDPSCEWVSSLYKELCHLS